MGRADRVRVVQLLGVEGKTEGSLDTRAEGLGVAYQAGTISAETITQVSS